MSELPKVYEPQEVETKWYRHWLQQGFFRADAKTPKAPFSIVIPPPNITGSLHMGHALFVTLQDILTRWRRMGAYNALWLPGTDHAGIATQMVVERMITAREGKTRHDLGRDEFVRRVWQWKDKHGSRITEQLKLLGASLDWDKERFTLDEGLSRAVREAFARLHEEGLIYRAERLINWCSHCLTALSDLEVEHEETSGTLWHISYPIVGEKDAALVVATTRPETLFGDTAVAVHPEDERFNRWIGHKVKIPLTDREVPIIGDATLVDREFGTGAVKVTPAHDFNDFETAARHNLERLIILEANGLLNEAVPPAYRGLTVKAARTKTVGDLQAAGLLVEEKPHTLSVGRCQRCETVVEPRISLQWFVRMEPLAVPAIEAVQSGKTRFVPESWTKTYMHWMTNIKDWCISRQLWWGHRIPVWYCADDHVTVSREATGPTACATCGKSELRQDEDVLDTWFSSSLWPFSTLGWPEETRELKTFYPTSVMETGYDILFFWVARMLMMGLHFMKKVPFRTVFLHAIVVDERGEKMSKVKGNVIDPIDVMQGATLEALIKKAEDGLAPPDALKRIEKSFPTGIQPAGADALRFTLAAMAAQGRNIRLSLDRVEGYRNFANKLWNAARFALMNLSDYDSDRFMDALRSEDESARPALELADRWILSRLQRTIAEVDEALEAYRFNDAAQSIYRFVWSELCDWYIEFIKVDLRASAEADVEKIQRRRTVQGCLVLALETACRLLHPFMPFITEEIWQQLPKPAGTPGSIMITMFPMVEPSLEEDAAEREMARLQEIIVAIRALRAEYRIPPARPIAVTLQSPSFEFRLLADSKRAEIGLLAKVDKLDVLDAGPAPAGTVVTVLAEGQIAVHLDGVIDATAERQRLNKEIQKLQKEQDSVRSRLENPAFVERAPMDLVEKERVRLHEMAERQLRIVESIERLKNL